MIKNNTPYSGKLKLKFEKNPSYDDGTVLNKIHIDLGFTKLVSRVSSETPDPKKIELINKHTGGRITTYRISESNEIIPDSFVTLNGDYIGDVRVGWWYYLNNMVICKDNPTSVAEIREDGNIVGYYGYSHRGGCAFKIGDRLFDENFIPMKKYYSLDQWSEWENQLNSDLDQYKDNDSLIAEIKLDGVARYVPFKLRGRRVISKMSEAKQSAINIAKYLS